MGAVRLVKGKPFENTKDKRDWHHQCYDFHAQELMLADA
jgi:hypothetical protein